MNSFRIPLKMKYSAAILYKCSFQIAIKIKEMEVATKKFYPQLILNTIRRRKTTILAFKVFKLQGNRISPKAKKSIEGPSYKSKMYFRNAVEKTENV